MSYSERPTRVNRIDPHELMELLSNGCVRGHRKPPCIAIRRATPVRTASEKSHSAEPIERDRGESAVHV